MEKNKFNNLTLKSNKELHFFIIIILALIFSMSIFVTYTKLALDIRPEAKVKGQSFAATNDDYVSLGGLGLDINLIKGCQPNQNIDFLYQIVGIKKRVQPEDCRVINSNEAIFHWGSPDDKNLDSIWTLIIYAESGEEIFKKNVKSTRAIIYSEELNLSRGLTYSWSVSYTNKSGALKQSSKRRFMISQNAVTVSMPKGIDIAGVASNKSHPRILPSGSSFSELKNISNTGDYKAMYDFMISTANIYKNTKSPVDPDTISPYPSGGSLQTSLWHYSGSLDYLALAYYFTNDKTYLDVGKTKLLELASWSPSGVTGELKDTKFNSSIGRSGDQLNRTAYLALASGYDLYYDYLTDEERSFVIKAYKERILQAWPIVNYLDTYAYDSHGLTILGMITQSLLHVAGAPEFSESKDMLAEIFDIYKLEINMFGYEDGGFGNGVEYAWHNFYNLMPVLEDMYLIANVNLTEQPYLKNYGDYLINFTLHTKGENNFPFGDGGVIRNFYTNPSYINDRFRSYALMTGNPNYEWYWRQAESSKNRVVRPAHLLLIGTTLKPTQSVPPNKNSWVSEDIGVYAAHSNVSDPFRSTLYFKSSPFGSYNHSLAESNTFTFDSNGKSLLINSGYYSSYGDEHHNKVKRATKYKNSLTVKGGYGQAERGDLASYNGISNPIHSKDTGGKIINYFDNTDIAAVTGDATDAYRFMLANGTLKPLLTSAIRSAAYLRESKIAIIYDYAASLEDRSWELNFHSFEPFLKSGKAIQISNTGTKACVEVYGFDYEYTATDKFDISQAQGLKNEHHVRLAATVPTKAFSAITIIREDCRDIEIGVKNNGSEFMVSVGGSLPIKFDKKLLSLPRSLKRVLIEEKSSTSTTPTTTNSSSTPTITTTQATTSTTTSTFTATTSVSTSTTNQNNNIQVSTSTQNNEVANVKVYQTELAITNTASPVTSDTNKNSQAQVATAPTQIKDLNKRESNPVFTSERVLLTKSGQETFKLNINNLSVNENDSNLSQVKNDIKNDNIKYYFDIFKEKLLSLFRINQELESEVKSASFAEPAFTYSTSGNLGVATKTATCGVGIDINNLTPLYQPSPSFAADMGATYSSDEVSLWRDRYYSNSYLRNASDVFPGSPADLADIIKNANAQVADSELNIEMIVEQGEVGSYHGFKIRDASFLYLITKEEKYLNAAKASLVNFFSSNTNNKTFFDNACFRILNGTAPYDAFFGHAVLIARLATSYDYLRSGLSEGDRLIIENGLRRYAYFFAWHFDWGIGGLFPNRLNDDYSVRGRNANDALTAWPKYLNERVDTNSDCKIDANDNAESYELYTHIDENGTKHNRISVVSMYYNNRRSNTLMVTGIVGGILSDKLLIDKSERMVKEWLKYGVYPDGTEGEYERNGDYCIPHQGRVYAVSNINAALLVADIMSRRGDDSLYNYSTTDGIYGTQSTSGQETKSLANYVKNYFELISKKRNIYYYEPWKVTQEPRTETHLSTMTNGFMNSVNQLHNWHDLSLLRHVNKVGNQEWSKIILRYNETGMPSLATYPNINSGTLAYKTHGTSDTVAAFPSVLFMYTPIFVKNVPKYVATSTSATTTIATTTTATTTPITPTTTPTTYTTNSQEPIYATSANSTTTVTILNQKTDIAKEITSTKSDQAINPKLSNTVVSLPTFEIKQKLNEVVFSPFTIRTDESGIIRGGSDTFRIDLNSNIESETIIDGERNSSVNIIEIIQNYIISLGNLFSFLNFSK